MLAEDGAEFIVAVMGVEGGEKEVPCFAVATRAELIEECRIIRIIGILRYFLGI